MPVQHTHTLIDIMPCTWFKVRIIFIIFLNAETQKQKGSDGGDYFKEQVLQGADPFLYH